MKLKGKVKFVNKDKSLFFPTLRKRVDAYFTDNNLPKTGNSRILTKSIILLLLYLVPFALLLALTPGLGVSLLLWVIMGVGVAGIAMSVMHDANHGAFSKSKTLNYLMAHSVTCWVPLLSTGSCSTTSCTIPTPMWWRWTRT
jgi:linoleoyl-CoA desaturase